MSGLVDKNCFGCWHLGRVHGKQTTGFLYCRYILDTHKSRPCPAGAGCTVYEKKPQGEKRRASCDPWDNWR